MSASKSLICVAVFVFAGCTKRSAETPEPVSGPVDSHHDEEAHGALPTQLWVTPEVARAADLQTEVARRAVLATTVSLPGELVPEPDRTARVSAATAGRLERVSFNEGSVVKRGDV
ncbi:MAG: hypothetical protein JNG84_03145, partial [Archangium sp.]|nr:hypothetical protein [Archangium sp.]